MITIKTLIIGIDGASPILIDRWIDELPTFEKIKKDGYLGRSIPPTPAQTPVAWTTFMTGKNPGKHGIFSFIMRRKGTYEKRIAQPTMLKSRTLWNLLSENGKKIGIVNVPMSDVEQIKGFIIPGFLSQTEGIPYPKYAENSIKENFGIERLTGDLETETLLNVHNEPIKFFERVNEITDETAQVSNFLAQKEDWNFFMTVFMGTDRIQHFFWKYVDPTHERYEENQFATMVKEYYVKLDGIIDTFLRIVDEEALVIVLSDHGFCPIKSELVLNNYLEELGFLKVKNNKVDLENSEAVSYGYGSIWLNVKGRESRGKINSIGEYDNVRDEISTELREIEIDGEKPIKDVKRREELWWGAYLDEAPDLNVIFNVGYQAARRPEITEKNDLKRYVNDNPRWSGGHDGTHDPVDVPGIIGILGPRIEGGKRIQVHLWDVAPTILKWMKIQIPPDMDGKPFL